MSGPSKSVNTTAPQAPARASSWHRSFSTGVELRLRGGHPRIYKVRFTRLFRNGGGGLGEAVELTSQLLADQEMAVRLCQFDDRHAAVAMLSEIGVSHAT